MLLALPTLLLCLPTLQAPAPVPAPQAVLDAARAKAKSVSEARAAFVKSGGNTKDFKGDCSKELTDLEARLAAEKRPEVRQALLVSRLFHLQLAKGTPTAEQLDQTLREVPSTSSCWTLDAGLLATRAEKDPRTWGPYVAEARAKHPDAGLRRTLLFEQFLGRLDAGDEAGWQAAMADIKAQFPPLAERAQAFLDAEAKTAPGKPAPAFTVKALGDPKTTYTLDSFKGRYVLIDFWATWCPDCRVELPALHAAWAKHQSASLDFLSLSFDRRVEHIAPFRQQAATPMPWKHAFIEEGFQSPLAEAFGVKSIPKALLIGPDGKIVASGAQLRGANLEKTLAKVLGN
ncbi:TlpA disulfide reductase family protein [Geothrix sp. PMB-07]|uniref:TlpA family protein disulfide reductase n=1 Tax=Geothrix sp. PMB-07 TaxID=3068640 RepID=UPI0027421151|nr:TlpA disulfide reductase family protein [Geothrix sp. PMB-07]WLT31998.1 TlpA disulfide reductase family protein [Geothrix sp. PMB-07]